MIEPTIEQLSELHGIIYGIFDLKNNKWYIGQTYKSFRKRYPKLEWWTKATSPLKSAYKKYGNTTFKIFIFKYGIIDRVELDLLEREYIEKYNAIHPNGYNFESGGHLFKKSHEISKKKISKKSLKYREKDYQIYDKDKNLYKFKNIITFARENNLDKRYLSHLVRGKIKRYEGWHIDKDIIVERPFKNSKLKTLIGPDGVEYKFYNIRIFSEQHSLSFYGVSDVLRGKNIFHKGFHLPNPRKSKGRGGYKKGSNNNPKKKYEEIVLERNGEIFIIKDDIDNFCQKYEIKKWDIYALTGKIQITAKGFKLVSVKYTDKFLNKNSIQETLDFKNTAEMAKQLAAL